MFSRLLKLVLGSHNDRALKKYKRIVRDINDMENEVSDYSDEQLAAKTQEFRQRIDDGETLDDLLVEAFAVVREASRRVLGMRPFDVQLIGAIVLHEGKIAEMRTGEGKTLVATMAVYLNALSGKGVHVVTVNDYLARRDAETMGKLYGFLGLTTGVIVQGLTHDEKVHAYNCDITYGTNNEFGFDYLRDNMKMHQYELAMRPFNYAIVDEVDSILIDEARVPLIISGSSEDDVDVYVKVDEVVRMLSSADYAIDEKHKNAFLSEEGNETAERILREKGYIQHGSLYDLENISLVHHITQALKAHHIFKCDVDYVVWHGEIMLIDEFTGRVLEGRRYSDGLHQAIEAKERVQVQKESQTLASITYQNFFRLYPKLSGMTGTAATEAAELYDIYKLETVVIPTNLPIKRIDYDDEIFLTAENKYAEIVKAVHQHHEKGQPILIGTVSIEKSEIMSRYLKKAGIKHNVLNARYHEQEADIIACAGEPYAVTIATNMAGRGTDIKLGGNIELYERDVLSTIENDAERETMRQKRLAEIEQQAEIVRQAGGLFVIGTERHDSRRIDNQLKGRSGRQGDPGESKFFLSLEDDLMRVFGVQQKNNPVGDSAAVSMMKSILKEESKITHPWMNKAITKAQKVAEAMNYDVRKHLLKFDDVMNSQRKVIYQQRLDLMDEAFALNVDEDLEEMVIDIADYIVDDNIPDDTPYEYWSLDDINHAIVSECGRAIIHLAENEDHTKGEVRVLLQNAMMDTLLEKKAHYGEHAFGNLYRNLLLKTLDQKWKEHLYNLDSLRKGINLRAYGQRDPLNEYKKDAYGMFEGMIRDIRARIVNLLLSFEGDEIESYSEHMFDDAHDDESSDVELDMNALLNMLKERLSNVMPSSEDEVEQGVISEQSADSVKDKGDADEAASEPSRNQLCPCGSSLRYKHCCGKVE